MRARARNKHAHNLHESHENHLYFNFFCNLHMNLNLYERVTSVSLPRRNSDTYIFTRNTNSN